MDQEKPNYYAIIPAEVRYDKNLRPNEKLLYGEITALTNKTGECWASNSYFAKLYNVTPRVVIQWIQHLNETGYITIKYEYKGKLCVRRIIKLKVGSEQKFTRVGTKVHRGSEKKFTYNNTSNNNTSIINIKNFKNNVLEEELDNLYEN